MTGWGPMPISNEPLADFFFLPLLLLVEPLYVLVSYILCCAIACALALIILFSASDAIGGGAGRPHINCLVGSPIAVLAVLRRPLRVR